MMVKVKVILGSDRPNRFGPQVAEWVMQLAEDHKDAEFELIDLKEIALPFLDEPRPPSEGNYVHDHTKAWAKIIGEADGFIWVHPEYNHGVNATLKNALDFIWREWNDKPVALVGYGSAAGGARAGEQLRLIAGGLKMFALRSDLVIQNYYNHLDGQGKWQPEDYMPKVMHGILDETVFWSGQLKRARAEMPK